MSDYTQGQLVRLSAAFTDSAGAAADPDTVTLKYRRTVTPAGDVVTQTYGAGDIVKTGTGAYHYDLAVDIAGAWVWRWESTGDAKCAAQGEFSVAPALL